MRHGENSTAREVQIRNAASGPQTERFRESKAARTSVFMKKSTGQAFSEKVRGRCLVAFVVGFLLVHGSTVPATRTTTTTPPFLDAIPRVQSSHEDWFQRMCAGDARQRFKDAIGR